VGGLRYVFHKSRVRKKGGVNLLQSTEKKRGGPLPAPKNSRKKGGVGLLHKRGGERAKDSYSKCATARSKKEGK